MRLTVGNFQLPHHVARPGLQRTPRAAARRAPRSTRVFSLEPRPLDPPHRRAAAGRAVPRRPCDDPVAAVARAREGEFVIQGPPGTGKSQTITNLVADYVARGKRVLFVCQKRAAIDVVHARLRQQGLDELACLIHDSQADKKAFVHGLKRTYEVTWRGATDEQAERCAGGRGRHGMVPSRPGSRLRRRDAAATPATGPGPRPASCSRGSSTCGTRGPDGALPTVRRVLPPPAADWWAARPAAGLDRVAGRTAGRAADRCSRRAAPWRRTCCPPSCRRRGRRPARGGARSGPRAAVGADGALAATGRPQDAGRGGLAGRRGRRSARGSRAASAGAAAGSCCRSSERAGRGWRPGPPRPRVLRADGGRHYGPRRAAPAQAAEAASGWREPLGPDDAGGALEEARAGKEGSFRLLRQGGGGCAQVRKRPSTPGPAAAPRRIQVHEWLAQGAAHVARRGEARAAVSSWARGPGGARRVETARRPAAPSTRGAGRRARAAARRSMHGSLSRTRSRAGRRGGRLRALAAPAVLDDAEGAPLDGCSSPSPGVPRAASPSWCRARRPAAPPRRPSPAARSRSTPPSSARCPGAAGAVEAVVAAAALDDVRAQGRDRRLRRRRPRRGATGGTPELPPAAALASDAEVVVARVREPVPRQGSGVGAQSAKSPRGTGRRKRRGATGRRELEHEFGKVMRYRSIRDLRRATRAPSSRRCARCGS